MPDSRRAGFTLTELVIVVAIIGILSAVAATKYGEAMRHADEGALLGDLGAIRSALHIYYSDCDGAYPTDLSALAANSRRINALPAALVPPYHTASAAVKNGSSADDAGGWVYNNASGDSNFGSLLINCTHTDSKGRTWSAY